MLAGIVAVAGVGESHSYGSNPVLGAVFGVGTAVLYAAFILLLRQATAAPDRRGATGVLAQPLYGATLGAASASLVFGLGLHDLRIGPLWPALGWLALLALSSQVIGWLLITVSMPRLPAGLVSGLLLLQPIGSVVLSAIVLGERPSAEQLFGVALTLLGVLVAAPPAGTCSHTSGANESGEYCRSSVACHDSESHPGSGAGHAGGAGAPGS
jgi:drug/metabolite transporter (DMT)-like permease